MLIGAVLGGSGYPQCESPSDSGAWRLTLAVGLAVLGAGATATTTGPALPWITQRLGADPAFGSGPLATIIQDVLSLLIYLTRATWLVT